MDYNDAVTEVLDKAARIRLPGHRLDVVTIARREFAKRGCCDSKFIDPIEETLRECIQRWSVIQKRQIWESTETGLQSDVRVDACTIDSIDMDLEGELMFHLIEYLSPDSGDGRQIQTKMTTAPNKSLDRMPRSTVLSLFQCERHRRAPRRRSA